MELYNTSYRFPFFFCLRSYVLIQLRQNSISILDVYSSSGDYNIMKKNSFVMFYWINTLEQYHARIE